MTISQRIFALLREKKLSQKELSEYTGISPAAISSWKSKGTNPSSDKIVKISEFLDVDVYYLLTGEYQPASNLQIAEESDIVLSHPIQMNIYCSSFSINFLRWTKDASSVS